MNQKPSGRVKNDLDCYKKEIPNFGCTKIRDELYLSINIKNQLSDTSKILGSSSSSFLLFLYQVNPITATKI